MTDDLNGQPARTLPDTGFIPHRLGSKGQNNVWSHSGFHGLMAMRLHLRLMNDLRGAALKGQGSDGSYRPLGELDCALGV